MFLLDCDPDKYSLPFLCPAVTQAEDPEKLLDTVVTEMQEDLIKMRQAAAQVRGGEGGGRARRKNAQVCVAPSLELVPQPLKLWKCLNLARRHKQDLHGCQWRGIGNRVNLARSVCCCCPSRHIRV